MNKLLLAFTYWEGDRAQAMNLARLIADLEPRMSETADVLFSARFDCAHDEATILEVAKKFRVHAHINRNRRGVGWPAGPNDLVFGTLDYVYTFSTAKRIPPYKAVLLIESDAGPLRPGWIEELSTEWDKGKGKVKVLGPMMDSGMKTSGGKHINGNCMISADKVFLHWFTRKIGGCTPAVGWDWVLAPQFKRLGWADCKKMRSWYRCPALSEDQFSALSNEGVVYLHGPKDSSLLDLVRKKFLT
jgi:hypothetical protein